MYASIGQISSLYFNAQDAFISYVVFFVTVDFPFSLASLVTHKQNKPQYIPIFFHQHLLIAFIFVFLNQQKLKLK